MTWYSLVASFNSPVKSTLKVFAIKTQCYNFRTQMGIPVASKRSEKLPPPSAKFANRPPRPHPKRDELPPEYPDADIESHQQQIAAVQSNNKIDDFKRPSEVSRMGNYFNIVIAPPPIKALQPRKILNNGYEPQMKRLN